MAGQKPQGINELRKNPGTTLDLNNKYKEVNPVVFDGLRVIINRGLSKHFRVTHGIYLSSITPGNYRFGVTYVGSKIVKDHEAYPVLLGNINSMGNLNASIYHIFGSRLKVRLDGQMENCSFINTQLTAHYFGNSYTASAIVHNPDVMSKSGSILLQYLQNVTPTIALGTEFALLNKLVSYNKSHESQTCLLSQISLVGRYSTPLSTWSTVLSKTNLLLNCYQKASEQIEFGLEVNTSFKDFRSVGSLGFKVTLPNRGVIFKGNVDTNTNVMSLYQRRICNTPFAILVSTNLNMNTGNFRLGLGFIIE